MPECDLCGAVVDCLGTELTKCFLVVVVYCYLVYYLVVAVGAATTTATTRIAAAGSTDLFHALLCRRKRQWHRSAVEPMGRSKDIIMMRELP